MAGWVWFVTLAAGAGLLLALLRYSRTLWMFAASSVALAAAGYVWQGNPALAGASASAATSLPRDDAERIALREGLYGRFGAHAAFLSAADAMMRAGAPELAAKAVLGGIRAHPGDLPLWTELGLALAANDRAMSPAAIFAFDRAAALNPAHPAPPFFLGMAQVRLGNFAAARPLWLRALRLTPTGAPVRTAIALRLMLLDRLIASGAVRPG